MKNTFKFFAAALIIVAAASCTKENPSTDSQVSDQKLVHKVFTASLIADSKTTLVGDPDGGAFVHWTKGDKIVVLPTGATNASTFSIVDDSIEEDYASFAGNVADANSYVGIYPAEAFDHSETSWDNSGIIHFFKNETLATQYANVDDFPRTKYGNANMAISTSSKNEHLYFENINAYLKFTLSVSGAVEIVFSADAISDDAPSTGSVSTQRNLGATLRFKNGYTYSYAGDDPIVFKVDDNKSEFEKDAVYYVAIPAVYIKGLKMTVKDANGNILASYSKTSDFTAEPNMIYNIGAVEGVKVGDFFYSDGTFSTKLDNSKTVVGVVFYVGDPTADDTTLKRDYPKCTNGLVVGLTQQSSALGTQSISWEVSGFMTTIGVKYNRGVVRVEPAASLKTGYNNTKAFEIADYNGPGLIYCRQMPSVAGSSTWFIPTIAECDAIRSSLSVINASIAKAGGTKLDLAYATSTAEDNTYSVLYNINSGALTDMTKRSTGTVRPIFAF